MSKTNLTNHDEVMKMERSSVLRVLTKEEFVKSMLEPIWQDSKKRRKILIWGNSQKNLPKKTIRW